MIPDISEAVRRNPGGTIVALEVTAGNKTDSFPTGYNPWRKTIGCSVRAEPTGGKANIAVTELVADTLEVPRTAVSLVSGSRSPLKKIFIAGIPTDNVIEKIADLLASKAG